MQFVIFSSKLKVWIKISISISISIALNDHAGLQVMPRILEIIDLKVNCSGVREFLSSSVFFYCICCHGLRLWE